MINRKRKISFLTEILLVIPVLVILNAPGLSSNVKDFSLEDLLWIDIMAKFTVPDHEIYIAMEKIVTCIPLFYSVMLAGSVIIEYFDEKNHYLLIRVNRRSFFGEKIAFMIGRNILFAFTYMTTLLLLLGFGYKRLCSVNEFLLYLTITAYLLLTITFFAGVVNLAAFYIGTMAALVVGIVMIAFLSVAGTHSVFGLLNPLHLILISDRISCLFVKCLYLLAEDFLILYVLWSKCVKRDVFGAADN